MRAGVVVVVGPGSEGEVALVGVGPVSGVGPLAQSGLDEAFGFAIGLRRVRACAAVFEAHLQTSLAKLVGAIAAAVIGEQSADDDAVASEEVNRLPEEGDGGVSLLIGEDASEGQARVIIDSDVQGLPARMFMLTTAAAITAPRDLLEAGHALDVEMEEIARKGMLIAHHRRPRMQIAPAAETSAAQNAADGGRTESGALCNLIGRTMLTAKLNHQPDLARRSGSWTVMRTRGTVAQSGNSFALVTANPLRCGFGSYAEAGCGRAETQAANDGCDQRLSTAKGESGILVDVHSVCPEKLDCSSQSASPVPIEWTTS